MAFRRLLPPPLRRRSSLRSRLRALESEVVELRVRVDSGTLDTETREAVENLVVSAPIALRALRRGQLHDGDAATPR